MESVGWAIAAFLSNPSDDADEIVNLLAHHGVPADLAHRLVELIPLAFGRCLLHGPTPPATKPHMGGALRLVFDEVFSAVFERAQALWPRTDNLYGLRRVIALVPA